jgi:uncharacterized protein
MSRSTHRCCAAALLLGSLAGCSAGPLPGGPAMTYGAADYAAPVHDMISRRFLTVIRQGYDFSCGSAALATLLRFHYNDPQTEPSVFMGMWRDGDRAQIRRLGFSLLDMKRYLAARGLAADGYRVDLAQIAKARVPGIALINTDGYKHFVVVKGIEAGRVLLGDPALGLRHVDVRTFAKMWNGIYFVLNTPPKPGVVFSSADEWALAPRAVFMGSMEPVSLQALALTRPFPGEI